MRPDAQCSRCGERPEVTHHLDGSYASVFHRCPNAIPGPAAIPQRFEKGRIFPSDPQELELGIERARVRALALELRETRRRMAELLVGTTDLRERDRIAELPYWILRDVLGQIETGGGNDE